MKSFLTHSLILISFFLSAQSTKIQIIDSLSLDPVPFATVHFSNNRGLITNEIGFFELLPEQIEENDSLFVSSIGFERVACRPLHYQAKKRHSRKAFFHRSPLEHSTPKRLLKRFLCRNSMNLLQRKSAKKMSRT